MNDHSVPDADAAEVAFRRGARILVTRLRYLGDALLSLPLVAALRRALPECELHYMAEPGPIELLREQPEIDVRWRVDRGAWPALRLVSQLRAQRFAAVIDLFCNPRSALLVRATGARIRIGEDRRLRRHSYTLARRLVPGRSAIDQHLDALRGLSLPVPPPERPVLRLSEAEIDSGERRWQHLGAGPRLVVHLAATQPAKEWPTALAVELVHDLARRGFAVALSSAPHRPATSAEVAEAAGKAAVLLPVLPLRELLGVVQAAAGVVAVDGAIAHAAVALGRPTVALFGPTDPRVWFPYSPFGPYRVLHAGVDCGDCDRRQCPERRCMRAIAPDTVRATLLEILSGEAS